MDMLVLRLAACRASGGRIAEQSVCLASAARQWVVGYASGPSPGFHEAREQIALGPLHRLSGRQIGEKVRLYQQAG